MFDKVSKLPNILGVYILALNVDINDFDLSNG